MFVSSQANGDFTLKAAELADRFGLSEHEFHRYMALGLIVGRVEIGSGDQEGTRRLSLRFGNRMWRAIVSADNSIQDEEMAFLRGNVSKRRRSPRPDTV
ncbi:DUF6522 family protein [Pararhizobium sp. LjRoot238]|uniref:DUF6522 family protein n=1 Tax=Pararhizobium sp. LjRoot238 TaxID=3342293 RepID=UPI003ECC6EA9